MSETQPTREQSREETGNADKHRMDWLEEFFSITSDRSNPWQAFYSLVCQHGFRYAIDEYRRREAYLDHGHLHL